MTQTPMDTLIGLAKEARDKAAQLLAGERRNSQQLAQQVEVLANYRQEYGRRLEEVMDQGIDVTTLRNYQGFLRSLDSALDRARDSLAQQQHKVSHCQQHWQQSQQRLSSFDTLAQRRRLQQARQEARREARQHDEISNNLFNRERLRQASSDQ